MRLIESRISPKQGRHRIDVRDEPDAGFAQMVEWLRDSLDGTVWWTRTQFRDPKRDPKFERHHQRHFEGGHWITTFWFSSKKEAALFALFWRNSGHA